MFSSDSAFFSSIRSIIKKMHQISDRELTRYGISHAEMRILLFLYENEECRQEELSRVMGIDRTNIGRSLKKLEGLGYVVRDKDPDDARSFLITLDERGRDLQVDLEKLKTDIEATVTKGVSSADFEAISKLLQIIDNNLSWNNYESIKNE
ncbi:MAG: MarR family transcriptional regulator [Spirochaetales bacterium]|nr:MarR family transcriptional regulator [Spirochaetales bacterium]